MRGVQYRAVSSRLYLVLLQSGAPVAGVDTEVVETAGENLQFLRSDGDIEDKAACQHLFIPVR